MKLSWLGLLNFIILQWFFIRLAIMREMGTHRFVRFKIKKWIVSLSGWNNNYRYIVKRKDI